MKSKVKPETKMNVIEFDQHGGPDVLKYRKRPLPIIKSHEIMIKVTATGVNGPDLVQRRGHYPPPKGASDLLGLEVSGEVVELGSPEIEWKLGDKVCALTNGGGYAEYVTVNASHCLPIPSGISEVDAAGLPETYFTVWSNVFYKKKFKPGMNFLIHGGAGGIGSTAIQLGKLFELNVFVTASSQETCQHCMDLGADHAINYHIDDFVPIIRDAGGADMIVDIIGGDYLARNIKAARADATIIQLAFNHGSKMEIDLMPLMLKRLTLTGSTLRSRPDNFKAAIAEDLRKRVWPVFSEHPTRLKTTTFCTFSLEAAAEAHTLMESSGKKGKILLTV